MAKTSNKNQTNNKEQSKKQNKVKINDFLKQSSLQYSKVSDFNKIRYLMTRRDKIILLLLLIATFILSILETFAISIIMPFITFASNPDMIFQNKISNTIYNFFAFNNTLDFMVTFSVILVIFYVIRAIYNMAYSYALNRFAFRKYHFFAYRLFCKATELSYLDFTNKNADIIRRNIITEAMQASHFIQQILMMGAEIITIILMYILLLIISWKMTIVLTLILAANVFLITQTISKVIQKQGILQAELGEQFLKIISKTLGNFKIIKLKGEQQNVLKAFDEASSKRVKTQIINQTLSPSPKFILETIGFCILIAAVAYILIKYNNAAAVIPIISMYALALYRILPAVNRILQSYNMSRYYKRSLEIIYEDLIYHTEYEDNKPIDFNHKIELKNVDFEYTKNNPIIKDFNLTINKGDKIAFIGKSGAGKSTLIDLIIGIYKPKNGVIEIDGVKLDNSNLRSWRKKIGYIPQNVFLFDGNVAENIALEDKIDEQKIINVCKKANIWDFLEANDGINTIVGDGGIKLSGGQKQRIAIARALYNNPEILVLDEATSALDNDTESRIMDEIYDVAQDKTLLIIAHRLSTIERCERKIEVK